MLVNPHERTRIDTLMNKQFDSGIDSIITDEVLLISYDYQQQHPNFYSKWFYYKHTDTGTKGKGAMTVGEAVAAAAARPNVFHPKIRTGVDGQL